MPDMASHEVKPARRCYDYLVVGAGIFGATFARLLADTGARCLVIDRRHHIAGNCYTECRDDIDIHMYGPHVFHTNNLAIWNFVNRYAKFRPIHFRVLARYGDKLYSLPFSLQTLYEFYGDGTPEELLGRLAADKTHFRRPKNLREQALNLVGHRIYEAIIEGYTAKQWGREAAALPAEIIRRLAVRQNYSVAYHDDTYQGVPELGYTGMVKRMLEGVETHLGVDYLKERRRLDNLARHVVYSGPLDSLYNCSLGPLEWRYLEFDHQKIESPSYQGTAVVNYTSRDVPWTRITEHKHFTCARLDHAISWITKEFSRESGADPSYPIEDGRNRRLHEQYRKLADADGYIIGGRLAEYRYYDMHQVIGSAIHTAARATGQTSAAMLSG
jgi:UDP-galactopyranose mutase